MTADHRNATSGRTAVLFRHVQLPEHERFRCAWRDRGIGTVVARIELLGTPAGYDVELDSGHGFAERALPCDIRRIDDLRLVLL